MDAPERIRLPQLEARLKAELRPAIAVDRDYRILHANEAYVAHYGVRPKLGQDRCFEVSHGYDRPCDQRGEDCPLQRALRSTERERVFHVHEGKLHPQHVEVELTPVFAEGSREVAAFLEVLTDVEQVSAHSEGEFVGRSRAMSRVVELMRRAAPSQVPVLLVGESGTGKQLCARALHAASARAHAPFVVLECAGLDETAFEAELMGLVPESNGKASGGLLAAAHGGTLFLDEIGDLPAAAQTKLLRLLESVEVGTSSSALHDVRLICATHHDLRARVDEGRFRRDLYYRINTFPIELPPLRERLSDVPLLAESLLRGTGKQLAPAAAAQLARYDYPGNVRELRNLLERAVLLADGPRIELHHLPEHVREARVAPAVQQNSEAAEVPRSAKALSALTFEHVRPLDEVERDYLRWALTQHAGDRRSLADALGVSERTLYRKLQKLELEDASDDTEAR